MERRELAGQRPSQGDPERPQALLESGRSIELRRTVFRVKLRSAVRARRLPQCLVPHQLWNVTKKSLNGQLGDLAADLVTRQGKHIGRHLTTKIA